MGERQQVEEAWLQNQETDTEDSSRRDEGRSVEESLVTAKQWSEG